MKNKMFALRLGGGKIVNRKRENLVALIAALLIGVVMLAVPALAGCPPGTIDLGDTANYGTAPAPITATGNIVQPGTYCVPATGVVLGGALPTSLTINTNGVAIVGQVPEARLTTSAAVPVIIVAGGVLDATIQNFTIRTGAATHIGIRADGKVTIQGMTFDDGGGAFANYAIQLGGNNPIVKNNTFKMAASTVPAIQLDGGMGARIFDNEVQGTGANPSFFIENASGTPYNDLQAWNNTIDFADVLIGGANGYTNSIIRDNTAGLLDSDGIDMAGNSTNTQVLRNVFTYGAGAAAPAEVGLIDRGGSNNEYRDNRITRAAVAADADDDAIQVASSNVVIAGNRIDATGGGDAIDATGGATTATITNNVILGAGGAGILMTDAANSNFTIIGNSLANAQAKGIDNGGGGTNHTISNNTFTNITDAPAAAVVVGVIESAGNSVITANTITGVALGAGAGAGSQISGILTGVNDQVAGNTLNSISGGNAINVAGGNAKITGNQINSVSAGNHGINLTTAAGNSEVVNNTIDTVSGGGDGILLASGNQTITGNTVRNILTNGIGIDVADQDNNELRNNMVDSVSRDGIRVTTGDNNTISGNTITDAAKDAVDVAVSRFAGIRLVGPGAMNTVIDGNTIINPGSVAYAVGIDVLGAGSDNNEITGNTVKDFTTVSGAGTTVAVGIRLQTGDNAKVEGNTVQNSGKMRVGIDILTPSKVSVKNNTIEGMTEIGLLLRGGTSVSRLEVEGNTLTDNVTGISMEAGAADITNVNKITGGITALRVTSMGNAGNFKVRDNCIDSPILANNNGFNTLNATGNYWATPPVLGVNVFGNVVVADPLASCPDDPGVPPTVCYIYPQGWNLLSVPLAPNDPAVDAVFDEIPGVTLYHYDACGGSYITPTEVSPTEGYWLYLPGAIEICFEGTVPETAQTIVLPCAGWHQIGTAFDADWLNTQVSHGGQTRNVVDAGDWISLPIFSYDPVAGRYNIAQTMKPHLGYWVHTKVDNVTLTIPFQPPGAPSSYPMGLLKPEGLTPPPPPPIPGTGGRVSRGLIFTNAPNPITDVHTTTFMVKGVMATLVEQIKVQIFDLSGRLVFEAEEVGTRLDWHTDNKWGEYLANGVYLYKLYAWIDGQWVVSEVKKLAIFR